MMPKTYFPISTFLLPDLSILRMFSSWTLSILSVYQSTFIMSQFLVHQITSLKFIITLINQYIESYVIYCYFSCSLTTMFRINELTSSSRYRFEIVVQTISAFSLIHYTCSIWKWAQMNGLNRHHFWYKSQNRGQKKTENIKYSDSWLNFNLETISKITNTVHGWMVKNNSRNNPPIISWNENT